MRKSKSAFTLVEVIMAVALIAMGTALVMTFLLPDGDSLKRRPPDMVLMSAIKAARLDALKSGRDLSLYYNKLGYFSVCDTETAVEKFKLWLNPKKKDLFEKAEKEGSHLDDSDFPNDVEIEFYQIYPEVVSSSILSFSEEPLKCLRFSADSSMTHAKIVVRDGGGEIFYETDIFTGTLIKRDKIDG